MKSSTFVLALAAGASSSILPRDGAQSLADIGKIDTDTKALTSAVTANPFDLGAVVTAEQTLESTVKTATSNANGQKFTDDDSTKILSAVKSLIPSIVDSLNAAVFSDNLKAVATIVQQDLASLRSESDAFADALTAGAPEGARDAAGVAKACIDDAFASAAATKSASAACASNIKVPAGGSGSSPTTSGGGAAPTGSASASGSASAAPSSTKGGEAPTASAEPTVAPTQTGSPSKPTGGSAGPTGTYAPPPTFTGAATTLKAGFSGAILAALALVL